MTLSRLFFVGLALFGAWNYYSTREIHHSAGVMVETDPIQINVSNEQPFSFYEFKVTPLAKFSARARVLSASHYHLGRETDLSPVDLALGWGAMSNSAVIEKLEISQSNRFYFYSWNDPPPIPLNDIIQHSANMHFIPANTAIEKKLRRARTGNIIEFSGYLIRADAQDGWHWVSSLTRNDSGAGACEVVFVDSLSVQDR